MIAKVAEFIIAYAKDSKALRDSGVGKIGLTGDFSNPDNDPRGDWASKPWKVGSGQSGSRYKITSPNGKIFDEEWMGDETTYKRLLTDKRIIFPKKGDGFPRKKYFRSEREQEGQCATNWWPDEIFGHNQGASDMLAEIFGQKNVFDNPKPIELIQGLIQIANVKNNDIVMDFFAGSGTTAHASFEENENFKAKFILIQFPEQLNSQNKDQKEAHDFCVSIKRPPNIAEICKERIRRVLKGYGDHKPIDNGFKVFKLGESNYYDNLFEYDPEKSAEENDKAFKDYLNKAQKELFPAKINELDIVYENIIKEGLNLNAKIEEAKIGKSTAYKVSDAEREFYVSLDEKLGSGAIDVLTAKEFKGKIFICFDGALTDSDKANLALNLTLKTI